MLKLAFSSKPSICCTQHLFGCPPAHSHCNWVSGSECSEHLQQRHHASPQCFQMSPVHSVNAELILSRRHRAVESFIPWPLVWVWVLIKQTTLPQLFYCRLPTSLYTAVGFYAVLPGKKGNHKQQISCKVGQITWSQCSTLTQHFWAV